MAISASQVKELREKTGMGMMECKNALTESDGDMEKAIVWLRERGMSRAAKKSGRVTAEGVVEVFVNAAGNAGILLEINCETDFVSKNEDFLKFTRETARLILDKGLESVEQLAETANASGTSVGQELTALIQKIGENMNIRRFHKVEAKGGRVAGYSHMGGKIGSLVAVTGAKDASAADSVAKELAMHVAAAAPRYLKSSEVDATELDQEREISRKKLEEEGKAAEIIDKILQGQMAKFYKEICLVEQPFVKDPGQSVDKYLKSKVPGAEICGFVRFQLGEGIEKKSENFADEVAAVMKGS